MSLLVDRLEIGSISVFPESEEKMEKSVEANDPGPLYMYNAWGVLVSFPAHSCGEANDPGDRQSSV